MLKGEMAKYGLTIRGMADILGISYQAMLNKLHGKSDFTLTEAKKIVRFFNAQGESHTVEDIFFASESIMLDKAAQNQGG